MIDREIESFQDQLVDEGKEELSDTELMFERIKRVPEYTDDDKDSEDSRRYTFMAKNLVEKIEGLRAEIDPEEFDPQNIRENIKRIIDIENIRNRGFNTAVNNLTSILDTSKMGYQYIENLKNARELIVREYEDMDPTRLPDERYQMQLKFYDNGQLENLRSAYDKQMEQYALEIQRVYDIAEVVYQDNKKGFGAINDFEDLAKKVSGKVKKVKEKSGDPIYEEQEKLWNEILELKAEDTDVERLNQTYLYEKDLLKKMLRAARDKVKLTFGYENPKVRVELDKRIDFLERQFEAYDYAINPYHIQPGLILDVDITSIKRKRYVLNSMANVLNEFLNGVSKGFQDAAFASFKRRRSTVRSDINQSFATEEPVGPSQNQYAQAIKAKGEAQKAKPKGKADVTPSKSRGKRKVNLDELSEM
ncbi:MAG: cytoplasmic filament protein CfpA, partial [Spirochaetaceae bacterium]|nr:cytoplasmic filament protein CfpA [Spirochaetaceae bacterium]